MLRMRLECEVCEIIGLFIFLLGPFSVFGGEGELVEDDAVGGCYSCVAFGFFGFGEGEKVAHDHHDLEEDCSSEFRVGHLLRYFSLQGEGYLKIEELSRFEETGIVFGFFFTSWYDVHLLI